MSWFTDMLGAVYKKPSSRQADRKERVYKTVVGQIDKSLS